MEATERLKLREVPEEEELMVTMSVERIRWSRWYSWFRRIHNTTVSYIRYEK